MRARVVEHERAHVMPWGRDRMPPLPGEDEVISRMYDAIDSKALAALVGIVEQQRARIPCANDLGVGRRHRHRTTVSPRKRRAAANVVGVTVCVDDAMQPLLRQCIRRCQSRHRLGDTRAIAGVD